jgi:hypothetical protein
MASLYRWGASLSRAMCWIAMTVALVSCGPTVGPTTNSGRGFVAACGPGQRKVCVGQCANIITQAGGVCDRDPCLPATRPAAVCGPNLRCDSCPADVIGCLPGEGICRPISAVPDQATASPVCDPHRPLGTAQSPCLQTPYQYCRGVSCGPNGVPNAPGLCAVPLSEGQQDCDGDWANVLNPPAAGATACRPCGPGLACMGALDGLPTPGARRTVCLRRCDAVVNQPSAVVNAACQPPSTDPQLSRSTYDYRCELHSRNPASLGSPGSNVVAVCARVTPHGAACAPAPSYESHATTDALTFLAEWCPTRRRLPGNRCPLFRAGSEEQQFVTSTRSFTPIEPIGSPSGVEITAPCSLNCDQCQPNTVLLPPPNTNDERFQCCRLNGQGCDQDSDCCQNGSMPARCVPYSAPGATGQSASPQRVCRRGCDPAVELSTAGDAPRCPGNTFCAPATGRRLLVNVWPQPPPNLTFGSSASAPTPAANVCIPCGQEGEPCCAGFGRPQCGATVGPDRVANGAGAVVTPNLTCLAGMCRDRRPVDPAVDPATTQALPTAQQCGGLGQTCCPPAVADGVAFRSLPGGPVRIPQGSRCVSGATCGAGNTCVRCGAAPGDPCCDLDLSNQFNIAVSNNGGPGVGAPTTPIQNFSFTPVPADNGVGFAANVCSEQRRFVDLIEETICPPNVPSAASPPLSPRRCGPIGLACVSYGTNTDISQHNPATSWPGTCERCGGIGQPCCDGNWCGPVGSQRVTCTAGGICAACGGCGQTQCQSCGQPCDTPWTIDTVENRRLCAPAAGSESCP